VCGAGTYKNLSADGKSFTCSTCEPGFQCASGTSSAELEVTLVIHVGINEFTPALRQAFTESVAFTAGVQAERVKIVSVSEHVGRRLLTNLRRMLSVRRLLTESIEVEFEITYLNVNNASFVTPPTLEQFAADAEERGLPVVQALLETQLIVYDQRIPCEPGNICAGGDQVLSCRIFSFSSIGAQTQADCHCVPGFFSLNSTSECKKCVPGNFCPGGVVVNSCAVNSTSAPGAAGPEGCFCKEGHWRGCTRTNTGAYINNTGQLCAIDFAAPCVMCRANDICFNDTLLHCPDNSASLPGSSKASDCVCDGGFAVQYF
jgi:hypothetical protein